METMLALSMGIAAKRAPSAEGLEAAFCEYYPRIVETLDRMMGNRHEAEEVAVDAFLKLAEQRREFADYDNLGGWLYRTATRLGIDFMRSARRRRHYEEMAARESRPAETPLDEALRADRQRTARAALARLRPSEAQLLMLRAQGLSYNELANALHIKASSVGKLLERAQSAFERAHRREEARRTA